MTGSICTIYLVKAGSVQRPKVESAKIENSHFCVVFRQNFFPMICSLDMELKLVQRKILRIFLYLTNIAG